MTSPSDGAKGDDGIKVTDRRSSAESVTEESAGAVKGPGWEMHEDARAAEKRELPLPPFNFSTFCLSLATSTMIHLGLAPVPGSEQIERQLPLAKQTIDILGLLQEKTKGNLTSEEEHLLSNLLYDLRLRYVEAKGKP